mgnify:FL=1
MNEQRLDEQFLILHGKAGNWPGDTTLGCAEAIYRTAKTFSANSVFLDISPGPGRSTIFLADAAKAVGAKVYTVGDFAAHETVWYNRAVRLFHWQDTVEHRRQGSDLPNPDFIVMRRDGDCKSRYESINGRGAMLIIGDGRDDIDGKPAETGQGYALWRKA